MTPPARYLAGLDGLRAIAVLAVVAYHLDATWMPGGFLGVDLFMVLSGFLITRLLLEEVSGTGRVDVRAFWVRRAKRLLPAVIAVIATVTVATAMLFASDQLERVRGDAIAGLLYVANWRFVAERASYFDLFSEASPFRHLWSLAIEEQFYVIWPLVAFAVARHRRRLAFLAAVGVVASAAAMAVLVDDADPSRVYYGTDTRIQTLLVGALLAIALHGTDLTPLRRPCRLALPPSLMAFVAVLVLVHDDDRWLYRGGFLGIALLGAVVVGATIAAPGSVLVSVLEHPVPRAIGRGSYSIYLWHWPVIVLATPTRLGLGDLSTDGVRLVLTGVLAALSYRFVESPIRHRAARPRTVGAGAVAALTLSCVLVAVATSGATAPAGYFSADGRLVASPTGGPPATDPASLSPGARPPRVLVVGDSVAASLATALLAAAPSAGLDLAAAPVSGCGLLPGLTLDTTTQQVYEPSRMCETTVQQALEEAITATSPDLVVWLSIWDAENRQVGDATVQLETDPGRATLAQLVADRVAEIGRRGARTALVTIAPVAVAGDRPAPPDIKQQRIAVYDDVLRATAAADPSTLLIDLATHLCPAGAPCADALADGTPYRPSDGIHFDGPGAPAAAEWIVAELARQLGVGPAA